MKVPTFRRTRRKSTSQPQTFFRHAADHSTFFSPAEAAVQRKCETCEAEKKSVQRKESGMSAAPAHPVAGYIQALPGRGEPLAGSVQSFFRSRLDADLSTVRIH